MIKETIHQLFPSGGQELVLLEGIVYFVIIYVLLRIVEEIALRVGMKITSSTNNTLDDALFAAVKSILMPVTTFVSLFLTILNFFPDSSVMNISVLELFIYVGILLAAWVANRMITTMVKWYDLTLMPHAKGKRKELFSFVRKIFSVVIYAVAIMIMLDRTGIEIAPLLAGLGIAGLAVALALQDSLSNLFAGMHILADKPFRVGDFIVVNNEDRKKGWVEEIGWRSTRIRFPDNNMLIVPNAKLASTEVLNSNLPSPEMAIVFTVGASYEDEPDKVLYTINGVVDEVLAENPDAVKDFKIVRLNDYKESSIEYLIVIKVKEFMAQYGVVGDIKRKIYYAFKKDGISIPFPQRDVHFFDGKPKKGKEAGGNGGKEKKK